VHFVEDGLYQLTMDDESHITVNGDLVLNDSILLKGTSSSLASLITEGSITSGKEKVQ